MRKINKYILLVLILLSLCLGSFFIFWGIKAKSTILIVGGMIIFIVICFLDYLILKRPNINEQTKEEITEFFENSENEKIIYTGTDIYLSIIYKKIIEKNGYFEAEMIDNNTIRVFIVEPDGKEQIREELSEYTFDEFTKNFKFADET